MRGPHSARRTAATDLCRLKNCRGGGGGESVAWAAARPSDGHPNPRRRLRKTAARRRPRPAPRRSGAPPPPRRNGGAPRGRRAASGPRLQEPEAVGGGAGDERQSFLGRPHRLGVGPGHENPYPALPMAARGRVGGRESSVGGRPWGPTQSQAGAAASGTLADPQSIRPRGPRATGPQRAPLLSGGPPCSAAREAPHRWRRAASLPAATAASTSGRSAATSAAGRQPRVTAKPSRSHRSSWASERAGPAGVAAAAAVREAAEACAPGAPGRRPRCRLAEPSRPCLVDPPPPSSPLPLGTVLPTLPFGLLLLLLVLLLSLLLLCVVRAAVRPPTVRPGCRAWPHPCTYKVGTGRQGLCKSRSMSFVSPRTRWRARTACRRRRRRRAAAGGGDFDVPPAPAQGTGRLYVDNHLLVTGPGTTDNFEGDLVGNTISYTKRACVLTCVYTNLPSMVNERPVDSTLRAGQRLTQARSVPHSRLVCRARLPATPANKPGSDAALVRLRWCSPHHGHYPIWDLGLAACKPSRPTTLPYYIAGRGATAHQDRRPRRFLVRSPASVVGWETQWVGPIAKGGKASKEGAIRGQRRGKGKWGGKLQLRPVLDTDATKPPPRAMRAAAPAAPGSALPAAPASVLLLLAWP
jgi:hypothetical protein